MFPKRFACAAREITRKTEEINKWKQEILTVLDLKNISKYKGKSQRDSWCTTKSKRETKFLSVSAQSWKFYCCH